MSSTEETIALLSSIAKQVPKIDFEKVAGELGIKSTKAASMRYQRFKASRPDLNGAQADQTQTSGTPNSGAHDNSAGGAEGTAGKGKAKPKAAKGKTGAKAEVGDADEDGVEASPVIPVKTTKKRKIEAESE